MPDPSSRAKSIIHPHLERRLKSADDSDTFPVVVFADPREQTIGEPVSERGVRRFSSAVREPVEQYLRGIGFERGLKEGDYQTSTASVYVILAKQQVYDLKGANERADRPFVELIMYDARRAEGGTVSLVTGSMGRGHSTNV